MNVIQRIIFNRNKPKSTANHNSIRKNRHHPLFKVKSGVKAGAIDISALSLDTLSHSHSTFDSTLNSDLFIQK